MRILFCGTAAAEGWPGLFCTCEPCDRALQLGGKNLRSRAAYMVDDRIRVDFGPDSYHHQQTYGLKYQDVEHLIVTHSHDDHWFPADLGYRRKGFSARLDRVLPVWGNSKVREKFVREHGEAWDDLGLDYRLLAPWDVADLGEGLTAVAVEAAHDPREECLNYLLRQNGSAALLGHDTGWYSEATWDRLQEHRLNLLVLDCTYGPRDQNKGHLGCSWVVKARDEFERRGILEPDCKTIATHFSHNGGLLHEELEALFAPDGIQVAYDGLAVEV